MAIESVPGGELAFERWIPLARQVVRRSLRLGWEDVFEIYSYIPTIPLAEALALEARRAGGDTHITLMTDDLWFTSMRELPIRWLRAASPVELAINQAITAYIYLGGPADARRMREIPPEKFDANAMGNVRQDEPKRRRRVRSVDLPIGRLCPERAEAYGLDYEQWRRSYEAALAVDLREIQKAGTARARALSGPKKVQIVSEEGTDLRLETEGIAPLVDDGIVSDADVRRGLVDTSLPAGKVEAAVRPNSAEGEVCCADPLFLMGRTIRGVRFRFEKGQLVEFSAEENPALLTRALSGSKRALHRLGWFSIGLNPAANPCMLDNSIVRDDVGIGFGPHPQLGRWKTGGGSDFFATIGPAQVEITRPSQG